MKAPSVCVWRAGSTCAVRRVRLLLPPTVAALLSVGVAVWITGAFHEDGLADAVDGIGGGYERQRILEIMRQMEEMEQAEEEIA